MPTATTPFDNKRFLGIVLAFIAWFGIILQLYITTENYFNVFSYFTILSNILVAVGLTCSNLMPYTALGKYFSSISVQSAIALYIFIVGLVYNLVLRGDMGTKRLAIGSR